MKSLWRVRTQNIAGTDFFQVHRYTDVSGPRDEKHIETYGGFYTTEAEAVKLANLLNSEEKKT